MSISWVHVYIMSPCLLCLCHESFQIIWVHFYTMSQQIQVTEEKKQVTETQYSEEEEKIREIKIQKIPK